MNYDQSLIDAVIKHADIVRVVSSYINLTKKGKNYVGVCPFHDDTNPSLTVSPEKRIFKCFVCGTAGSAIVFVQKYEHLNFFDAMRKVAEISGYSDPRLEKTTYVKPVDQTKVPLYKCLHDLTTYYQYALATKEGEEGLEYFTSRNLDAEMQNKFKLGYAFKNGANTIRFLQDKGHSLKTIEDCGVSYLSGGGYHDKNQGRAIFPICDEDGQVVGFSARRIKDGGPEAKYVNTSETKVFHKSSILYNYHIAKERAKIEGYVYVLEGFMDVFALAKIGINSAVALMGTAFTKEHINMLRKLNVEIRLCLDGDVPGQTAMMEAAKALHKEGIECRIVDNQGSTRDPDEILNNEGENALRYYLTNLISRVDFALNYFRRTNPLKTAQQKKALVQQFIPILLNIKSQLELDDYLRKLSQITGFEPDSIREVVKSARKANNEAEVMEEINQFKPERKVLRKLEIAERELLYLMTINPEAVAFFEENVGTFYDEMHRQIANYIVEYSKFHDEVDLVGVLTMLEGSDIPNKNELIKEITDLSMEESHANICNEQVLQHLYESITEEQQKIFEKDVLEQSKEGKSPLEQARIIANYNRRKVRKAESEDK